jgi:hypothetical protein
MFAFERPFRTVDLKVFMNFIREPIGYILKLIHIAFSFPSKILILGMVASLVGCPGFDFFQACLTTNVLTGMLRSDIPALC